jgi:hypothetical protein
MIKTIDLYDFKNAFSVMNRHNQFSDEGLEWLFDYCEELERDLGESYELDVMALCCDFQESTYKEIIEAYGIEIDRNNSEEDIQTQIRDFLEFETVLVNYDDSMVLFQQF